MNPEIQKLRQHYYMLPTHVRSRTTAQFLIRAIQIAEELEKEHERIVEVLKELQKHGDKECAGPKSN